MKNATTATNCDTLEEITTAFSNKYLNQLTQLEAQRVRQSRRYTKNRNEIRTPNSNYAYQTTEFRADQNCNNNSDQEPFAPGTVNTAFIVWDQQMQKVKVSSTWFLNLCTSYHLCNNQSLFTNIRAKSIDFVIVAE